MLCYEYNETIFHGDTTSQAILQVFQMHSIEKAINPFYRPGPNCINDCYGLKT